MATVNLINPERAKYEIAVPSGYTYSDAEDDLIAALIAACSQMIHNYCNRVFPLQDWDEIYSGNLEQSLAIKQSPIVSVQRVATTPLDILSITNTSWPTNSRATVQVTANGLKLVRVASGTTTPDETVLFATYTTLATVATAVTALGNGWSASVLNTDYNTWESADLRAVQGALACHNSNAAILKIWEEDLNDWEVEEGPGFLTRNGGVWPRGTNNIRVSYTAGYDPIPEDIQKACATFVAGEFAQSKRDPMSATGKTADHMYNVSQIFSYPLPGNVSRYLSSYRRRMR